MAEEHAHEHKRIQYTIHLVDRHWWGGRVTLRLVGVSSGVHEGELVIMGLHDDLYSINYGRVRYLHAQPLEH